MPDRLYTLEVFIPERTVKRAKSSMVPLLTTVPDDDWFWEDGEIRWVIDGTALIDRDFGFYPVDQVLAVLNVIEAALQHKAAETYIGGSIIQLLTRPIDRHRCVFIYDLRARPKVNPAEQREAAANIVKCATSVLDSVDRINTHLRAAHREVLQADLLEQCRSLLKSFNRLPPNRHGKKRK